MKTILSLIAMCLAMEASAQYYKQEVRPLRSTTEAKDHEWKMREKDGAAIYRVSDATLEHFAPATESTEAVVVCPGGAYAMLAYEKEGQEIAEWLSGLGYHAYVLAYSVPNNRAGALEDAQEAVRQLRKQGYTRVGIIGFSAGGSLSCRTCTNWQTEEERPDFGILIYPAYLDEGEGGTLSSDLPVTAQTPPLFVFGTEDDVKYSGPSCKTIMKAMQEANAPIELHYLTKGGHGYGKRAGAGLIWPPLAEAWLKTLK